MTSRPSKSQHAYRVIRDRITDGSYSPGYRLVLGQLARELEVSTVPVREAVRLLEAEGLVSFERNVGARVSAINPTEYRHAMQAQAVVEGAATGLAAPLLAPDTVEEARAVNERMRASLRAFDPHAFTRLNREFHSLLYRSCPNPVLLEMVERGWTRLAAIRASTFAFVPGRAAVSVDEHDRLLDLVAAGADPDEVERRAREHRLATLKAFLTTTENEEN